MSRVKKGDVLDEMNLHVMRKFEFIGSERDNLEDGKRSQTSVV